MSNTFLTLPKKTTVTHVVEALGMLMNHIEMERIQANFAYEKQALEMYFAYAMKRLEEEMARFCETVLIAVADSIRYHERAMCLLEMAMRISNGANKSKV
jgi:translation elongation factor EF-1alpha